MSGRAKPPFGIQFGRKMAAIIGKIPERAKSFIPERRPPQQNDRQEKGALAMSGYRK
ncbi:hypothetical protein BN873_380050 [Candidatus Competibacter denitrificans Run_A_D11]|jgi:hypothetical protein|uniref:Uncharacterized protein n=1 Tax=Candidatus Competibacter denitrificans Run_A_D11 TaxID=1400863 RepID=W6MDL4_9GAMM|nr:hypothetical protein BN873_380050 [Candidatus Competibacter denitrificans Run_A_D11]